MADAGQISLTAPARLFSAGQIVLATFLGAPLAGCLLLAGNYLKLGNRTYAWVSVLWGAVSTAAVILLAFSLPENFPNYPIPVASCIAMRVLSNYLQGSAIASHFAAGGRKGSWVAAVAAGLLCLALIVVVTLGVFFVASAG